MDQKNNIPAFSPDRILIEQSVRDSELVRRVSEKCSSIHTEIINDARGITGQAHDNRQGDAGKKTLLLARQRGPFMRPCPGTSGYLCCGYFNLDVAEGCDLNCSYCVLQGYLKSPLITLYANVDDMFAELDDKLEKHSAQFFRIGTGELSDSLTFDHLTGLSIDLVNYFAGKENAIIELKSKNIHIQNILGLEHKRRTVVSWSLNADNHIAREEASAPPLGQRLEAAAEAQRAGYWLGFHFDPMIYDEEWEEGYKSAVERLMQMIRPENIAWISLGGLRYPQAFDQVIRENHPDSDIVLGELLPGMDHKLRYFKPIRIEMFKKMHDWLRSYSDAFPIYLCMESDEVWQKAFGWSPGSNAGLKKYLDDRVQC
jgi:spore photoproduct lyase